jgi:hypothetical protein
LLETRNLSVPQHSPRQRNHNPDEAFENHQTDRQTDGSADADLRCDHVDQQQGRQADE